MTEQGECDVSEGPLGRARRARCFGPRKVTRSVAGAHGHARTTWAAGGEEGPSGALPWTEPGGHDVEQGEAHVSDPDPERKGVSRNDFVGK